jgi:hypothetical protein
MDTNNQAPFGYINMEKETFHQGKIIDGKMCFEEEGAPTDLSHLKSKAILTSAPEDETIEYESYLSGPKWSGIKEYLFQLASRSSLKITFQEDRGWISTTFYYKLTGSKTRIYEFLKRVRSDVERHNK